MMWQPNFSIPAPGMIQPVTPLGTIQPQFGIQAAAPARNEQGLTFDEVLQKQQLRFSAHANQRLQQREIQLDAFGQDRLENAVEQAAQKGAKTSLVLVDGNAFVVNIPNKTVITAVDSNSTGGTIFTNIDSTVIA